MERRSRERGEGEKSGLGFTRWIECRGKIKYIEVLRAGNKNVLGGGKYGDQKRGGLGCRGHRKGGCTNK